MSERVAIKYSSTGHLGTVPVGQVVVDTGYRYEQERHSLAMTLCCTAVLRSTAQGSTT